MIRTRWQSYILILLVAILGGAWIHMTRVPIENDAEIHAAAHVNFQAPDLALTTLDGAPVALADLRGKVVLINFWATWCPPCRSEMPEILAAAQAHPNDFVVLAINSGETDTQVQQFAQEFHLTFPVLLDRESQVTRDYQVLALPTSFFVDRNGIIRAANVGAISRAYIEAQIKTLGAR